MKNKYFILLTSILILQIANIFAQTSQYNISNIHNFPSDSITRITDLCFVDVNTGYITGYYNPNSQNLYGYLFKTTNCGINWVKLWKPWFQENTKIFTVSFANANTGYLMMRNLKDMYYTTNGGANFTTYYITDLPDYNFDQVLSTNSNGNLFVLRKEKNHICKYSYPFQYGNNSRYNFDNSIKLLHMEISKTSDVIYVCGRRHPQNHPFLAKSTDGGATYSTILDFDGYNDTYDISSLFHMNIINNGSGDIIKISGAHKLIEYNSVLNNVTILSSSWAEGRKITFSDANNGFYMNADITNDEPPLELGNSAIYRTTNNGQNWLQSFSSPTGFLSLPNRFFSFGNVVYFTQSNDNLQAYFYSRNLNEVLATYRDNVSISDSFKINNNNYTTPNTYTVRGGIYPLWTKPILNEGQSDEKLFYRWSFNNMSNSVNNYELFYDGELAAHYKTKQIADNAWAINNANQTKAIRDTSSVSNGMIHQVHESIGGIFYTRSTNGGANWSREEVVNNGFSPNDAFGNKNPSVTIKRRDFKPLTINVNEQERNVAIVWERYNQSNGKIEILTADRVLNTPQTGYEWKRTEYENGNTIFASFDCSSYPSFISTPKIFVSSPLTDLRHSVVIVPHLEKNNTTGKVKVVVTIRYNLEKLDYVVDNGEDGMISNLAVSSPFNYFNNGDLYDLNIVYQKDNTINNIVYKKVRAGKEMIGLFADTIETEENLGDGDGMRARFTPDISVQNGLPVVTYCGNYYDNRIVQYEGETGSDNMISLLNHTTITLFKTTNNGAWSEYVRFTGLNPQENPNVEGSKNAMAYLLSFRKNGSYFQYVKINGLSQYYCTPESYSETDAKFVRGSYIGQFGSNYNPLLLTLSNPDANFCYTIGQQPFSISNIGSGTDGFNNLDATIEKDNTLFSFTLGPIIASNTTYGFEDDTPPQTVHNPVEFNETMVSAVFSLSDNDTLLIGAHGKYTNAASSFQPLKYHVDLINASTMEIHRELFRDTINIEDSVGIEFLRGYVINNIAKGTDQFYVQMVVDTVDAEDADYSLTGVYEDDTPPEGDAPKNYKTKIFFENSTSSLTTGNQIPKNYDLSQNYPNPFNPVTKINYALPKQGFVTVKIYDITGREIKTLVNEVKQAGYYAVNFNGSHLSSGVYFYRIQSGDFVQTKRMVLVK